MGKFLLFFFGLGSKKSDSFVEYQYDDINGYEEHTTVQREPDIIYENNAFDGGDSKEEKNFTLYKSSDLY